MSKKKRITDKQRLDWIDRRAPDIRGDFRDKVERFIVSRRRDSNEQNPLFSDISFGWYSTVRKAIDAAMNAKAKAGRTER